ncbi:hypothetical protein VDIAB_100752 [Vibrio diabolicus]|nr:hypothetical protein VDIAB_100752 [Vibrio diabolicus]
MSYSKPYSVRAIILIHQRSFDKLNYKLNRFSIKAERIQQNLKIDVNHLNTQQTNL